MNDLEQLRRYRRALELTQRDVAARLNCSHQLVKMIELGAYPCRVDFWIAEIVRVLREEDQRRQSR